VSEILAKNIFVGSDVLQRELMHFRQGEPKELDQHEPRSIFEPWTDVMILKIVLQKNWRF
jgi:hypothetical protein